MRPHIRAAILGVDPTQPSAGDRYLRCRHVRGDAAIGFKGAHILYIQSDGPTMHRFEEGERPAALAVRWLVLCDSCYERHDSGEDNGVMEGTDHEWPEDATITYEAPQ